MTTTPTTEPANETQVGGHHYKSMPIEHWDIVTLLGLDYFQGQITKYVMRWKDKNGVQDLKKAAHFLQKYIELQEHGDGSVRILSDAVRKLTKFEHDPYANDERDAERYRWFREQQHNVTIFFKDGSGISINGESSLDEFIDKQLQSDQREAIRHQEGD